MRIRLSRRQHLRLMMLLPMWYIGRISPSLLLLRHPRLPNVFLFVSGARFNE